jgi:hypothetical protein
MKPSLSPTPFTKLRSSALGLVLAAAAAGMAPQPAQALTIILDFTQVSITEDTGAVEDRATLTTADFSDWGFTGLDLNGIKSAVLTSVNTAYLAYPTMAADTLSPLPSGQRLNLSFELGTVGDGPSNGDADFYYFGVGQGTNPAQDFLGQACYGCVRSPDDSGVPRAPVGSIVGVNLTNNLQGLTDLAATDTQRINILAGTIAHEFGHSLFLDHPVALPYTGSLTNPGTESLYSIMGTGADPTGMPDEERVKARAFSYAEFGTLMETVGTVPITAVPEPSALALLLAGLGTVVVAARRKRVAAGTAVA